MLLLCANICFSQEKKTLDALVEENKGKVVVVDFWASWCAPCRAELPDMHRLLKALKGKNVAFVFISLDTDKQKWETACKEDGLMESPYSLMASTMQSTPLSKSLKVQAIPRYVVFDTGGKVVNAEAPRPSEGNKLQSEIEKHLKK